MKIGFYWIQKDYGGVDTHLLNLIKFWPSQDDQFIVFTNRDNDGFISIKDNLKKLGVKHFIFVSSGWEFLNYKIIKILHYIFFPIYFVYQVLNIIFEIKKFKLDCIIVQNGGYPGSFKSLASICASWVLKLNKRILIIHHGSLHNNVLRRFLEKYLDFIIPQLSSDVVTVSRATRNTLIYLRGWDPTRSPIRVIHNGIENKKIKKYKSLRKQLKVDNDKILLGIVGRIDRYKGHEDLIIAISELPNEVRKKIRVVIIGKPKNKIELDRLKALAKKLNVLEYLIFIGYWKGDIREVISQLSILAMVTKDFEGFGYTILEAMSCKIPVLCTDVGAVKEFVNSDMVTIIPPEDPSSINTFLNDFCKNSDPYLKKTILAAKQVHKFSAKRMSKQFARIVKSE